MPHIEIHYTQDIALDTHNLSKKLEHTIKSLDATVGGCKSRAYATTEFNASHIIINIWLLKKPHRDEQYNKHFLDEVGKTIKENIPAHYHTSLQLYYRDENYRNIE